MCNESLVSICGLLQVNKLEVYPCILWEIIKPFTNIITGNISQPIYSKSQGAVYNQEIFFIHGHFL